MLKNIRNRNAAERELGFGNTVGTKKGNRLMNPDGSMNVRRHANSVWDNVYYHLINMPWSHFILLIVAFFFVLNSIFALLYIGIGIENLAGVEPGDWLHNFMEASFFSTQTLTTVGYGRVAPVGLLTNIVASTESLTGLLSFSLISGLLYGRFSRPVAHIVFSDKMVVSPFQSGKALMFRMVNASRSELIETEVRCIISINQEDGAGKITKRYWPLDLQVSQISFFSLSWTLVHPLTESSPIFGFSAQDLSDANAEVLILVKGVDESNEQVVHARRSYMADEIEWEAKFTPIIGTGNDGLTEVVTSKISNFEKINQTT